MATSPSPPAARPWKRRKVLIALAVALAIGEFTGRLYADWRDHAVDWILQMSFLAISVTAVIIAIAVLVESIRSRRSLPTT